MLSVVSIIVVSNLATQAFSYVTAVARQAPTDGVPTITTATSEWEPYETLVEDPWQCATENMTDHFSFPTPTGDVQEAILSYAGDQVDSCLATASEDQRSNCRMSGTAWCGLTTAAPPAITPALSSFGGEIASWVSANGQQAAEVSQRCPRAWGNFDIMSQAYYNVTVDMVGCFAGGNADGGPKSSALSGQSTVRDSVASGVQARQVAATGALWAGSVGAVLVGAM